MRLEASLWHVGGVEQALVQVLNIGLGGAGIICQAPLRPEDRVMFSVLSPGRADPILLPARVAWARGRQPVGVPCAGLCFEIPDRGALFALFQLIGGLNAAQSGPPA